MRTLQVERALTVGGVLARGAFEGVVAAGGEVDGTLPQGQRLFDGHDLQARHGGEAGFFVEAGAGGLGDHGFGRFGQGQEHAHPGAFAFQHTLEVADHADADILTRLDADDAQSGALGAEVKPPVKTAIRALFPEVAGLGGDEGERPFLEFMILAPRRKVAGGVDVLRDAVGGELDGRKGIAQALFDQADGKVGDVDADF